MRALKKYLGLLVVAALLVATVLGASATDVNVVAVQEMDKFPVSWNPLEADSPEAEFIRDLTGGGMYRVSGDGKMISSDLAFLPEDVTAEFAGAYGVPETAVRGYAYRIALNDSACWDDGTSITADDWVYSGRELLESGSDTLMILANAAAYRNGETRNSQVISLNDTGYSSVTAAQEAGITDFYVDVEHYWGLGEGWRSIHDITRLEDPAMTRGYPEMYVSAAWLYDRYLAEEQPHAYFQGEFVGIAGEAVPVTLDDVGLLKTGDQELVLILQEPETVSSLAAKLRDFCLIREGYSYRSTAGSASYGPYRVAEVTSTGIRLEKNPNWWGESGEHEQILCR